jgi:hypothetical protein
MLDECWYDMTWLDVNVDNLHIKKIDLSNP